MRRFKKGDIVSFYDSLIVWKVIGFYTTINTHKNLYRLIGVTPKEFAGKEALGSPTDLVRR